MTVAVLCVDPRGVYASITGVELWDEARDARRYPGPHPVVSHPTCKRWGRYWWADGSTEPGNDGGLFASNLASVRRWYGVLEHPEASHAWARFGLPDAHLGSWTRGLCGGWATAVCQRNYGHRARKLTWLYYFGEAPPPALDWTDPGAGDVYLAQPGRCRKDKPRPTCPCTRCERLYGDDWRGQHNRGVTRLTARENEATPRPFADLLIGMARAARAEAA